MVVVSSEDKRRLANVVSDLAEARASVESGEAALLEGRPKEERAMAEVNRFGRERGMTSAEVSRAADVVSRVLGA